MRHIPYIFGLVLFGAIVFGYGTGKRDLWAPDEPRFGQIMREMIQRHDPFVLYLNGKPYSDKPPLYIWMAAGLTLMTGGDGSKVSSLLFRAPSVFGGILGLLATYALGRLFFGTRRAGLYSALTAGTMFMYLWQAGQAQLDMLMCGWSYLAVLCFWLAYQDEDHRPSLGWWSLFWIAAALATLSKGPPGAIVPLGTAVVFLMWQNNARLALKTVLAWAVAIFALTALARFDFMGERPLVAVSLLALALLLSWGSRVWLIPLFKGSPKRTLASTCGFVFGVLLFAALLGAWFIPYKLSAPRYASSDTLFHQTLTRYLAGVSHQEAPWYYLTHLPHNLAPWTLFVAVAIFFAWRPHEGMSREPRRFIAAWALFTLGFFSLSPGKRDQYLLPSIPAYALMCGWLFDRLDRMPRKASRLALAVPAYVNGVLALLAALAAAGFDLLFVRRLAELAGWRDKLMRRWDLTGLDLTLLNLWPLAAFCLIMAVAFGVVAYRKRVLEVFAVCVVFVSGANLYVNGWLLPAMNPIKSGRAFTAKLAEFRTSETQPVGIYNIFRAEYMLYGDYPLIELVKNPDEEDPDLRGFLNRSQRAFVLMREKDYERARTDYPDFPMRVLSRLKIGSRELVLIDNRR